MIKNYLRIAIRNLMTHKVFSFINVIGLAIGMAACLLIVLFIVDEYRFDQHHRNKNSIYRLEGFYERGGKTEEQSSVSNFAIAPVLAAEHPEIKSYTRLLMSNGVVKINDKIYSEDRICYTDSSFFDVFTCPMISGTPAALNEPFSVVIDEVLAKKYFGSSSALGKTLLLDGNPMKVSGVFREMPRTSHFHAQALVPVKTIVNSFPPWVNNIRSGGTSHYTYLLLTDNYDPKKLESQFPAFIKKHMGGSFGNKNERLYLRPLNDIHLDAHTANEMEANGDRDSVYLFAMVALVILLIACINYINLTTAKAADRAKEIGLRKVTGASRGQLITQFLGESVLVSIFGMICAYIIALAFLPGVNQLTHKTLSVTNDQPFLILLTFFLFAVGIGIISGIYPAFFITSAKLTQILKGNASLVTKTSYTLRKGLVVFQFSVSIVLIISMLLIYSQLQFIRSKNLGLNPDELITMGVTGKIGQEFKTFKTELLKNSAIVSVSSANNDITSGSTNWRQYWANNGEIVNLSIATMDVDVDFFTTLKTTMAAGRGFSSLYTSDSTDAYVINETAAKLMNLQDPLNQPLEGSVFNSYSWHQKKGKIIGVVKDFHFASLKQEIKPVVFNLQSSKTGGAGIIFVRINKEHAADTRKYIEDTWKKFESEFPPVYSFVTEDLKNLYKNEDNFLQLFMTFCFLAVFISCLGILGLSSYTTIKRTKEIGVRKVLGASVQRIVVLLSKDFAKLVLLAFIIACPIGWYLMDLWLNEYAYRISISVWTFLIAGSCSMLIALLTISTQSIKAAVANPVRSLRSE